jgi:thioredoxin 1
MDGTPIEVTDATFDQTITQSKNPVIVDFWAPWCPPCRVYAPVIDELAKKFQGRILFAKVNSDKNPVSKTNYGIEAIPTLLFFSNGKVVQTHVGALEQEQLRNLVKEFLKVI